MFLTPLLVSASIFSIPAFLSSLTKETEAAGGKQNSQTLSVLAPARNIDPTPSVGGGDITLVQGQALLAEEGPSGTLSDIENAPPEATAISVYTVHKGDSLAGIAKMFNVTPNTIVWANDLKAGTIKEGVELVILPIAGVRYTVAKGDTLASLAKKYKADAQEIVQYNNLEDGIPLAVGTTIIIPDGEVAVPVVAKPSVKVGVNLYKGGSGPDLGGYYAWPVNGGVLTQGLHGYNGIDIGAPTGTGILAAAAGTVIIAKSGGGWNGGYGNYIVIQHSNGTQTLYGHASKVYVSPGQQVPQGATIGAVGRTGKATGPHLHFEVRGATNPFATGR
ncbi:LysM peptidoglycan-binding domain-containing protein [Candidatus Kaiserbacteria bacterium]|nr:LysM peptidoglycan-binding domain-containing protein [Candidatus Kaiserbacteria bacterium]